jgi:hypothetical protein
MPYALRKRSTRTYVYVAIATHVFLLNASCMPVSVSLVALWRMQWICQKKKKVVAHQGGERACNCASRLVAVQSSVHTSDVSGATDNRHGGDCWPWDAMHACPAQVPTLPLPCSFMWLGSVDSFGTRTVLYYICHAHVAMTSRDAMFIVPFATQAPFGLVSLKFNSHHINVPSNAWSTKCRLIVCMSAQIRSNLRDESINPN